jgi:replicative DNA helicase
MIKVSIDSVRASLLSQHRVVVLKEEGMDRYLAIWIGPYEADAITIKLQGVEIARPLTHDLLEQGIRKLGAHVSHILVNDLHDDTFYARVVMDRDGERIELDSRPSDAIALAVRVQAPIFVSESVMERAKNGWIYQAIPDLHERREPADFLTVTDELERRRQLDEVGGPAYVMDLINAVPTAIHAEHYARIVERTSVLRKLIRAAGQIAQIAYEETTEDIGRGGRPRRADRLQRSRASLSARPGGGAPVDGRRGGPHRLPLPPPGRDPGCAHRLQAAGQDAGRVAEERSGHPGRRPGVGKTSLAISLAHNAARKYGKRVAVFQPGDVQRAVGAAYAVGRDGHRLAAAAPGRHPGRGGVAQADGGRRRAVRCAIFIDDTPAVSAMELRTKARRLYAEHDLDLIVVDYLQLMQGDRRSENRVQEISAISRGLKSLARELNVPVLALSQLSRAVEAGRTSGRYCRTCGNRGRSSRTRTW